MTHRPLKFTYQDWLTVFCKKDILNADEFGLNYRMEPERTIEQTEIPGRKKQKDRLSVLACTNADLSEKLELMIIERAVRPRELKKEMFAEHGFDYHANQKAWMTIVLFF